MAALIIPGEAEAVGRFVRELTWGVSGESPDVSVASAGTYSLININEANVLVEKIENQVVVAHTATAVITIGDSSDVDGYWTDTLYELGTSAAVFNSPATTVGYAAGRLYTSSQSIDVVITGTMAAGKSKLRVTYSRGVDTSIGPATSS